MRIHPPKQLQIIFHRGAKVLAQPEKRLVDNDEGAGLVKDGKLFVFTVE